MLAMRCDRSSGELGFGRHNIDDQGRFRVTLVDGSARLVDERFVKDSIVNPRVIRQVGYGDSMPVDSHLKQRNGRDWLSGSRTRDVGRRRRRVSHRHGHLRGIVSSSDLPMPAGMFLSTASQTNARVQRAFPSGVASEDARALIGTAPAPPDDRAPDPTKMIVIAAEPSTPVTVAAVLDEAASQPESAYTFIKGLTADGAWQYVKDRRATGPYTRVAVEIMFLDHDAPVPRLQVERQIRWARGALGALAGRPPTESMTSAVALARANAAFILPGDGTQ